ncbi:MAG: VWA-like domain-containing protein [Pirellulales bacterium]
MNGKTGNPTGGSLARQTVIEPLRQWFDGFLHDSGFARQYPYYAAVLTRLDPIDDPGVPVMGVSAYGPRFYLHVNIDYFTRPADNARFLAGVLQHEVHHIVLGHLADPRFLDPAHPDLMELAMEMAANEHIVAPLPATPVRWGDYMSYGIRGGQSTRERYELLVAARLTGKPIPGGKFIDDHLAGGVGRRNVDPSLDERITRMVEEAVTSVEGDNHSRLAGKTAGEWLQHLRGVTEPPRRYLDWKAALQMFTGWLRTPRHTYSRPNRRLPGLIGVVPGRTYTKGAAEPRSLIVAIDTSGSMSPEELAEIGRHLRMFADQLKITIVECDTVIQRVYRFEGTLANVAGRGGTDLRPVFEPDFLRSQQAEGVIYFTDGAGPYPPHDPRIRTLWVLSKPWDFHCPWGVKSIMPDIAENSAPAVAPPTAPPTPSGIAPTSDTTP